MKKLLVTVLSLGVAVIALSAALYHFQPVNHFRRQSPFYHQTFIHACDQVLGLVPLGTNTVIRFSPKEVVIPAILHDVRPLQFTVSTNRLHIMTEGGKLTGFGIVWEPSAVVPMKWDLSVVFESMGFHVYSVVKAR